MKALVFQQQAEIDRLNASASLVWAVRVVVRCRRCQEVTADVRDPGILLDDGQIGETIFRAVLTGRQYASERVDRLHNPQPGQITAPRVRFPFDDQYQALIEHSTAAHLPEALPGFCKHGPHSMEIGRLLDFLRKARKQGKALGMPVSPRPSV